MASVNIAIVLGFVGDNPRINTTQSGRRVANFSVATTEKGYTAQNGTTYPDKTEWHNIICWGKMVDVVEKFVRKGSQLYIQGKMRTRSYEKEGQTRYSFEIECESLQLLDRRSDVQQPNQIPAASFVAASQPQQQYQQNPIPAAGSEPDLPF